jgi:Cu(I)/Ag(I) efflux system membrane fusion protein
MQWDARSRQTVASRAEGRILQVAVLRPGEKVARGQVLAYLESETAIAAQEEFLAILRNAPDLPADLARAQTEASRRRLETFGLSPARIAGRGRPYSSLPITSPRDGLLLEASARPGQYVSAGTALFSIGLADRVWAETWLLPDEVKAYPVGTEAWVRVEGLAEGPIPGRLEHIRQEASASGTVTLAHVGLGNAGGRILPGTQAWVAFRQPARKVLNLPGSALLRSSGMTEVWVETDPGAYAPRMVATGAEAGDRVEILSGIAPGEKVVVAGGYLLRSEWTLRQGAGMAHGGH